MSFNQTNTLAHNTTDQGLQQDNLSYPTEKDKSTTHHDSLQFKKGKKKQRLPEVEPNEPCFVHKLSVEMVTNIFARLDPVSLATAAKVCTYWRHIVNDDSCWRDSFVSYFGSLPFKRLSVESWKTEFILRTHLMRKWTKGRGTVMSFNPKIGSLESMYIDFDDSQLIVASQEHGVAAKCNPQTGKIDHRHLLYSTNEAIRTPITAVKVGKDRILWGFGHGFITLSVRTKSSANTSNRLKTFHADFHQGPVRVLALPTNLQDVVLSGAEDGQVKIWDVVSTSCAWTLQPVSALAKQPTTIEVTADQRIIIGYDDGSIAIWNIYMNQLLQLHRNNHLEGYAEKRDEMRRELEEKKLVIAAPNTNVRTGVKFISYDTETSNLIVAYSGSTEIRKYNANSGSCMGVFGYGHNAGTTITCMQWDKSPISTTLSLESALKPRPNSNSNRKKGGIIDLSTSSPRSTSGQGTPSIAVPPSVSARTTRVLVTGDDMGTICLWNGDDVNQGDRIIKPIRVLSGHVMGISCIYIDACKIITGSDDGWIRMWDPLTGININTLGNKIPKGAPLDRTDMNVMRVKNIWCNDYQGVATIGHQVKAWDFSPGKQFLTRGALKKKAKPCNGAARDRFHYEIGREVKESLSKLESEKVEREREERKLNKLSLGGLTDEEMLHYAMMLSQQENGSSPEQQPFSSSVGSDYVDDDEELMKAVIASLDMVEKENNVASYEQQEEEEFFEESDYMHINGNATGSSNSSMISLSQMDEWPTVAEAVTTPSSSNGTNSARRNQPASQAAEEEMDEELRYILELSKTEK